MRKNEFNSLDEFTSQYVGVWGPSDGHFFGLDFSYGGTEYRFHTGPMYKNEIKVLPDGREVVFGLYQKIKNPPDGHNYILLEKFATMEDVLESKCIQGIPFREVIMDDDTELLGQD